MKPLTPKEQAILDYIREKIQENGYSPSIRDIRTALDIRSTSTVHTYLERLEQKGYIRKENGKSRTLRVEDTFWGDSDLMEFPDKNSQSTVVPIIGRVAAGFPILAAENYEGYVHYPEGGGRSHDTRLFALRVKGESMMEIGIMDGDLVIMEKCDYAENGDLVVAMLDDEATVKEFYRENGHFRLQPRNAAYEPIIAEQVVVLGKVIASVRYY